ncbi:transmembrane protein, putative [Actinidia rufa]|uniref:Transmembrane protein, putative n=1 Tax=Actinidia rufa TaxID=165716 RepID=A0A7J0EQ12_9ERIC|nr:transmembrane protein, putative [Actinidia rufa]
MASEASQSISLKILVEKEKNRVVFAEANKDFVDVIFSFLTMPIGTIVSLIREHLLKGEIGCLNNLYESVEKLDEEYLASEHKEILLHPRSATEVYFRNLKLNLIENNNSECYLCRYRDCTFLSYYQIYSCRCGQALEHFVYLSDAILPDGGMFVKPTAHFIVTDDLRVLPMSTKTALSLLKEFGAMDGSKIEERSLNIGKDEILKLLKYSLASMTPLSDTIMEPFIGKTSNTHCVKHGPSTRQFPCVEDIIDNPQINLTLVVNKYDNKAVYYAEVGEDFVSVLCSFLAFPIGHVFKEFSSLSFKGCLGNLYRSIQNSDLDKLFKSEEMKSVLLDPKLAPGLCCVACTAWALADPNEHSQLGQPPPHRHPPGLPTPHPNLHQQWLVRLRHASHDSHPPRPPASSPPSSTASSRPTAESTMALPRPKACGSSITTPPPPRDLFLTSASTG